GDEGLACLFVHVEAVFFGGGVHRLLGGRRIHDGVVGTDQSQKLLAQTVFGVSRRGQGVETFGVGQVRYAALGEVEVVVGVVDAFEHDGGLGRFGHLQCVGGALYPQFADHGGQTFFLHHGVPSGRGPAQGVGDQGGRTSGIVGPGGLTQVRASTVIGLFHGDVGQPEEGPGVVGQCVGGVRPQGRDQVWGQGGRSAHLAKDDTDLFDSLGHRFPSSCGGGLGGSYRFFATTHGRKG